MGALCAHAAGSKSLYRNMLMRKGNRHIENNDDDDLYIMLMWRLFVCLSYFVNIQFFPGRMTDDGLRMMDDG